MEITDVNSAFKEFYIQVEGKPVEINAIGILRNGKKDYVVLTDMEHYVEADEYVIVEMVHQNGETIFKEITDFQFYNELCDARETVLERMEDTSIDS